MIGRERFEEQGRNLMGWDASGRLFRVLEETFDQIERIVHGYRLKPVVEAVGHVKFVGRGIARVGGLAEVRAREVIRFPGNALGMAFNLDPEEVGIVLLDRSEGLSAGDEVRRTGRVLDVPVGDALLGRVVDAVGRPLDGGAPIRTRDRLPIERPAPGIMDRAPVHVPLQTGLKVVDALIPVGRGQRELILGDRQTGKTAIALDAMINQRDTGVLCVYCAIGQQKSAVAKLVDDLANFGIREKPSSSRPLKMTLRACSLFRRMRQ
jgi:F-type H+-transporting ATPase subunit alpha